MTASESSHFDTLLDLCQHLFTTPSDHVAIEHYFIKGEKIHLRTLSYKDLCIVIEKVANVVSRAVDGRNTIIGLVIPPCTELIVCILGVLKAKSAFAPLELKNKIEILAKMTGSTKMEYILTIAGLEPAVKKMFLESGYCLNTVKDIDIGQMENVLMLKMVPTLSNESLSISNFSVKNLAYVLHTSGTTGVPKIIAVPHSCILPNIMHLSEIFKVNKTSKVALMSPPTFDPSIVEMFIGLGKQATLVVPSLEIKMNPSALLDVLFVRAKVTVLQTTPALVKRFSLQNLRNCVFSSTSSLKVMAFGGEQCPSFSTIRNWINTDDVKHKRMPNSFFNIYGITEVSSWATCHKLCPDNILDGCALPVPLGFPLWKTGLQIREEDENSITFTISSSCAKVSDCCPYEVNAGVKRHFSKRRKQSCTGRLYVGGKNRLCHILGENDEEFRDSGDLVELIVCGEEITLNYLGRSDSMIKRNGKKIYLNALCESISQVPEVGACHVMTVESQVIAFVVKKNSEHYSVEDIRIVQSKESKLFTFKCFQTLSETFDFKTLPDKIVEINFLPVTSHGKVDGKLLEQLYRNIIYKHDDKIHVTENYLKEIIAMVLPTVLDKYGKKPSPMQKVEISLDLTFQQYGGDSLGATIFLNWLDVFLETSTISVIPNVFDMLLKNSLKDFVAMLTENFVIDRKVNAPFTKRKRRLKNNNITVKSGGSDHYAQGGVKASFSRGGRFSYPVNRTAGEIVTGMYWPSSKRCRSPKLSSEPEISEVWKYNTRKCIDASPLIIFSTMNDGICYIGSHSHLFAAVSLSDGKEIWSVELPDRIESSACMFSEDETSLVIVGCYDGGVYCFEAFSGKLWWKFQTDAEVKSSPCWGQESMQVYVGSHDGFLYALNVKARKCQWRSHCGGGAVFSSPTAMILQKNQEMVFAATLGGKLICFAGDSGKTVWSSVIGKPIFSSPLACHLGVCVGCVDSCVYFFNHDGEQIWSFRTNQPIFSSPCLSTKKDSFIIGSHDGHLYNIRILDGSLVWELGDKTDGSAVYSTPFPLSAEDNAKNIVACASTAGFIYIVDECSGDILSKKKLPSEIFSSSVLVARPIIDSLKIVVGCRDDYLHCLKVTIL